MMAPDLKPTDWQPMMLKVRGFDAYVQHLPRTRFMVDVDGDYAFADRFGDLEEAVRRLPASRNVILLYGDPNRPPERARVRQNERGDFEKVDGSLLLNVRLYADDDELLEVLTRLHDDFMAAFHAFKSYVASLTPVETVDKTVPRPMRQPVRFDRR